MDDMHFDWRQGRRRWFEGNVMHGQSWGGGLKEGSLLLPRAGAAAADAAGAGPDEPPARAHGAAGRRSCARQQRSLPRRARPQRASRGPPRAGASPGRGQWPRTPSGAHRRLLLLAPLKMPLQLFDFISTCLGTVCWVQREASCTSTSSRFAVYHCPGRTTRDLSGKNFAASGYIRVVTW